MGKENNHIKGVYYENVAKELLIKNGYTIVETNYRCRIGEIDIIARNEGYLVFVEVKYRSNANLGNPLEAIDYKKQLKIRRCAQDYLQRRGLSENTLCRFDAIGITGSTGVIDLIKGAF